jgi:predicted RNA-binding Zn-ribbon protein involved in translation (DUF1610 family)
MGWKGYEAKIPAGMIFRKMYCCKCGAKLNKRKTSEVRHKGEPGYKDYILGHATIGMDTVEVASYVYQCPNCGNTVTYEEQLAISKAQKHHGHMVLPETESTPIENDSMASSLRTLRKLRWVMLLPLVGSLICICYVFAGRLSRIADGDDGRKVVFASILVLTGVALAVKLVLGFFGNIDFLKQYQSVIMLVSSMFAFNVPTLWYINHKFM